MIKSFGSQGTEDIYHGHSTRDARKIPQDIWKVACRKLDLLNAAVSLGDLKTPPANRLERLSGRLKEKYSIRINDQHRLVFIFRDGNVHEVEILDYH